MRHVQTGETARLEVFFERHSLPLFRYFVHLTGSPGASEDLVQDVFVRVLSFKTLNGALDVYFQPNLAANLKFKTFNGSIYSDFDVSPAPIQTAGETEQSKGKFVYRGNRFSVARAGAGGPELMFDAFNGNIRLHQSAQ